MGKLDERVEDEVAKGMAVLLCLGWGRGIGKGHQGDFLDGPPFPLLLSIKGVCTCKYWLIAI